MNNIGLVLEGGGMRGLYTAGVLEFFLENDFYFPHVVGVSAGACMAASYLSKQKGRNKRVNIGLTSDNRFVSLRNLFRNGQLFGMDFLFDEIPHRIIPFDFDTFLKGSEQFVVGTTDCETGQAVFYHMDEHGQELLKIIRASSSLPFISPPVEYNGKMLRDGGLIEPVPFKYAQEQGYEKNVVIMTKYESYEEKKNTFSSLVKLFYRSYPQITTLIEQRHDIYQQTIADIQAEEQKGNLFIIRPSANIPASQFGRNQKKLTDLYELGYHDAKHNFQAMQNWMNQR